MEQDQDVCCRCGSPTPEGVILAIIAARSRNIYYYCSEECSRADVPDRELLEQIQLDTHWPKEI